MYVYRKDYQQLVYSGLVDQAVKVKLLPPAIIKPVPLWSGKQVSSVYLGVESMCIALGPH